MTGSTADNPQCISEGITLALLTGIPEKLLEVQQAGDRCPKLHLEPRVELAETDLSAFPKLQSSQG